MRKLGTLSPLEKRAAILMAAAILLWLTDFLHHISPAVIAMGAGLFALLPRIGVLRRRPQAAQLSTGIFVAAAVSMGAVLEETNGLHVLTGSMFVRAAVHDNIIMTTIVMCWTAFISHFFLASEILMLGASMPLVMEFAKTHGLNPLLLGMIWTFAAGGKLFVYQSGVLIVGYSYGYFAARDLLYMGALLTVIEFVMLLLLVSFYWPLIGLH